MIGVEGDVLASGIGYEESASASGSLGPYVATGAASLAIDSTVLASLRAKAQVAQSGFQPYATIGIAFQRLEVDLNASASISGPEGSASGSYSETVRQTQVGFTAGAGADITVTDSFDVSVGYQYYRFNDNIGTLVGEPTADLATNIHSFRAGGNLKF